MDVFVSYRRDDTGGRAGRLADALVTRFGRRHVFQDVTAVAPGVSFDDQVDRAIAASDVVLVVIGRTWAGDVENDAEGGRRLDRPDDFVRHEVRAALRGDVVVVPVLVDGADLPTESSLPDDLRPLVRRQAVRLRDESWHRDVDALVRQLTRGPDVETAGRRRPRVLAGTAVAVIAALAIVAAVLLLRDDDSASSEEPSTCDALDESWSTRTDVGGPVTAVDAEEGGDHLLQVAPVSASWRPDGDQYLVQVTVAVTNETEPVADSADDEVYVSYSDVTNLAVDGVQTDDLRCVAFDGQQQLAPGRTVLVTLRFETAQDPDGAAIAIDLQDGSALPIVEA